MIPLLAVGNFGGCVSIDSSGGPYEPGYYAERAERFIDLALMEAHDIDEAEPLWDGTPSAKMVVYQWAVETMVDLAKAAGEYLLGAQESGSLGGSHTHERPSSGSGLGNPTTDSTEGTI
jgi:hypothetical protein